MLYTDISNFVKRLEGLCWVLPFSAAWWLTPLYMTLIKTIPVLDANITRPLPVTGMLPAHTSSYYHWPSRQKPPFSITDINITEGLPADLWSHIFTPLLPLLPFTWRSEISALESFCIWYSCVGFPGQKPTRRGSGCAKSPVMRFYFLGMAAPALPQQ